MPKEQNREENTQKPDITKLPKMEMYAVLGLELSQEMLKRLERIEDSLEILAAQKSRELNPTDGKPE